MDWYYLSGNAVATCAENQKWTTGPRVCKSTFCDLFIFLCVCIIFSFAIRLSQKLLCEYSHWLRSQDSGVWSHGVIFLCAMWCFMSALVQREFFSMYERILSHEQRWQKRKVTTLFKYSNNVFVLHYLTPLHMSILCSCSEISGALRLLFAVILNLFQ